MKIDFTKIITFLKNHKFQLYLLCCCVFSFFAYNMFYVFITKQYILFLINFVFGLTVYVGYDILIGKKIYYTKLKITQTDKRKNKNINNNVISKKREKYTE